MIITPSPVHTGLTGLAIALAIIAIVVVLAVFGRTLRPTTLTPDENERLAAQRYAALRKEREDRNNLRQKIWWRRTIWFWPIVCLAIGLILVGAVLFLANERLNLLEHRPLASLQVTPSADTTVTVRKTIGDTTVTETKTVEPGVTVAVPTPRVIREEPLPPPPADGTPQILAAIKAQGEQSEARNNALISTMERGNDKLVAAITTTLRPAVVVTRPPPPRQHWYRPRPRGYTAAPPPPYGPRGPIAIVTVKGKDGSVYTGPLYPRLPDGLQPYPDRRSYYRQPDGY